MNSIASLPSFAFPAETGLLLFSTMTTTFDRHRGHRRDGHFSLMEIPFGCLKSGGLWTRAPHCFPLSQPPKGGSHDKRHPFGSTRSWAWSTLNQGPQVLVYVSIYQGSILGSVHKAKDSSALLSAPGGSCLCCGPLRCRCSGPRSPQNVYGSAFFEATRVFRGKGGGGVNRESKRTNTFLVWCPVKKKKKNKHPYQNLVEQNKSPEVCVFDIL